MNINIPGIDVEKAIINTGSEELFLELLGDVYKLMDDKCNRVESCLVQNNIKNYTVEVHALKTTCRMIGAMDLGEEFFTLEKLGKENDLEQIEKLTPNVLNSFKALKPYLAPFADTSDTPKQEFDKDAISNILYELLEALDDFDLGAAEEAAKKLFTYEYDEALSEQVETLNKLVSNLDYEEAKTKARQIIASL